MSKKNTYHHSCSIVRIIERSHGHFKTGSDEIVYDRTETVTEPCNTPLFGEIERKTGVCSSCRKGWEVEGNKFASEDERKRALESK